MKTSVTFWKTSQCYKVKTEPRNFSAPKSWHQVEQIIWDQGIEEEVESAGREHAGRLFAKNPGPKPRPRCSNNTAPPLLATQKRGDTEVLFQAEDPSLALLPLPAFWSGRTGGGNPQGHHPRLPYTPELLCDPPSNSNPQPLCLQPSFSLVSALGGVVSAVRAGHHGAGLGPRRFEFVWFLCPRALGLSHSNSPPQ